MEAVGPLQDYTVIKRHKRLWICVAGTNVYTPPDFLRPGMRNRDSLIELARRFTMLQHRDITAIVTFEAAMHPGIN